MAEAQTDDTEFQREALKLLVQVAWANDHLHPKEREFLVKLAGAWKVPSVLEALLADVEQGKPLPHPNIALIRTRADTVLRAASALIAVDGEVDEEEDQMLAHLRTLLSPS